MKKEMEMKNGLLYTCPTWPQWGEEEKRLLCEALYDGEWGTLGRKACAIAQSFAQYCGVRYGIAVNNGTQALEIILRALNIGYGDEVLVPAYSFAATVSAVAYVGAAPVFVDIDPNTGCIDAKQAEKCISEKTKALIAVHLCGRPCDLDALKDFCDSQGIALIEDAAQAHGSAWRGRRVGSHGAAAAFSFQSSKTLSSGEGGMIVTDNETVYRECWHYHHSGRALGSDTELGGVVLMGSNARMAEWEAAILECQLKSLDAQNKKRHENADYLKTLLRDEPRFVFCPEDSRITENGYYMLLMRFNCDYTKRGQFLSILNGMGIPASAGYPPLHKSAMLCSKTFVKSTGVSFDYSQISLPCTEELCACAVWLPGYCLLGEKEDIELLADAYKKALDAVE